MCLRKCFSVIFTKKVTYLHIVLKEVRGYTQIKEIFQYILPRTVTTVLRRESTQHSEHILMMVVLHLPMHSI